MKHLLERLGLGRPELRAWAMYDWANSAFQTTIIAAVFPIYFHNVVAADLGDAVSTSRFAWATTIAIVIVALVAPLLGAIADFAAMKKKMLGVFLAIGVVATTAMYWIRAGRLEAGAHVVRPRQRRCAGSIVFYDRCSRISPARTSWTACRRPGTPWLPWGGVLLAVNLLMIRHPAWFGFPDAERRSRLSLASVAVWWLVFSIPLFRHVPDPDTGSRPMSRRQAASSVSRVPPPHRDVSRTDTVYELAFLLLIAFLIYNDGIQTIIRMATTFGSQIGMGQGRRRMNTALLITQFIGVPFAFLLQG